MVFRVYPTPQSAPLRVDPGDTTYTPFTQLTGPVPDPTISMVKMMAIRVGMFGGVKAPTLYLQAGDGKPVEAAGFPTAVFRRPETPLENYVGNVQLFIEASNVFRIQVTFHKDSTEQWKLGIKNNATESREFTWVVAESEAETAQPWIDVTPAELTYQAPAEETVSQSVHVSNKGTGVLNVTALEQPLPPGFTLGSTLPLAVQPSKTASLSVSFTTAADPPLHKGTTVAAAELVTSPPDTTASSSPEHNRRVSLVVEATTPEIERSEVVLLLDGSESMAWDAKGNPPSTKAQSRWGELTSAVGQFLDLLAHFGEGHGRYGIARFPAGDPNIASTYDLVPMTDIPGLVHLADAKAAIADVEPFNGAPMGDGLDHVLAPKTGSFATDKASVRANRRLLIVMSDSAQSSGVHLPLECVAPPVGTAQVGRSLADRRISLFAVAYGIGGSSDVNHVLMQQLAEGSHGGGHVCSVDKAGSTASTLATALRRALKAGLRSATSTYDRGGSVFCPAGANALHDVLFTQYDDRVAVVLSWNTSDAERLRLELLTPRGEHITPETAGRDQFADVIFRGDDRSHMYLFKRDFLVGAGGRHGTWRLTVAPGGVFDPFLKPDDLLDGEEYSCEVIVDSALRLTLVTDRATYFTGDPITVSAVLTVSGRPVTGAEVFLHYWGSSVSWLNWVTALQLPADALAQAGEQLAGKDRSPLLVKQLAARLAGLDFDPGVPHVGMLAMSDPGGTGIYQATLTNTTMPEGYSFYVTARGTTSDGVNFRREAKKETYVLVRPSSEFSQMEIHQTERGVAKVTLVLRDKSGNVLHVDPKLVGGFDVVTTGGTVSDLVGHLDGTYSFDLAYDPGTEVSVGFRYAGETVFAPRNLLVLDDLQYPDRVIAYEPGVLREANRNADPEAALGAVVGRARHRHVSLGAGGRLTVGFGGRAVVGGNGSDVTVFVQPDTDRRAYRLEAYSVEREAWVTLGESIGITESFPLTTGPLRLTPALRITDLSGRTCDAELKPLVNPGVSVLGVGVRETTVDLPWLGDMLPDWLWH